MDENCSTYESDVVDVDLEVVNNKIMNLGDNKQRRRLRVATWNFSGLCSERKQKEVGELLVENNYRHCSWSGILGKGRFKNRS